MTALEIDKRAVLELLIRRFNSDELRGVCFDLGIQYEDLDGNTLARVSQELIEYVRRRDMNGDLTKAIITRRPEALRDVRFKTRPLLMAEPPPLPDLAYKTGYDQFFGYMGTGIFSLQRLVLVQAVMLAVLFLALVVVVTLG